MPFGIVGRTSPMMRQMVGFGDRSTARGTFRGEFGARHCNQWGLYGVRCDSASAVGAAVWDGACGRPMHCCIIWGQHSPTGREGFGGFCFPFLQWEMPLRHRRWNVSASYAKTSQHFRSTNASLESSIRGLFWRCIRFHHQRRGLWEISKNVTTVLPKLKCKQHTVAARAAITATAAA